jgi:hypothetical protein
MSAFFKLSLLLVAGLYSSVQAQDEAVATTTNLPSFDPLVENAAASLTYAPSSSTGTNFQSFRLIGERNIFNQGRSPRMARRETTRTRPTPKVHALSLVGTMSYAKGNFAFFDGTQPEYRKSVKSGEKIAGYEVKQITPSAVKVANETQEFDLKVGQQLRREDEGEWQISTAPRESASQSDSVPSSTSTGGSSANISEEEALKRLMEKRAKELN